jgi:hypothetical protein
MFWDLILLAIIVGAIIIRHEANLILARAQAQGWQHLPMR